MKNLLLLALVSLLFPAVANATDPTAGHYTNVGIFNESVTFTLTRQGSTGTITHLRIDRFAIPGSIHVNEHHQFHFHKLAASDGGGFYSGHGVWFSNTRCHGDLRHYKGSDDTNTYHTWESHRPRQGNL